MMSLSSSQAGIVGARRKKLNSTQFSSYRRVKVEHNRPLTFSDGIPRSENSFIARHIYNYNKINNTFTFLGTQKGQSLIRKKNGITSMDNTALNNINSNKLYNTKDADLTLPEQIFPDVNFNINTSNVFDTKNLAHNEKVFVDVRWTKITANTNKSNLNYEDTYVTVVMNDRKGFIYRVGVLIKDNTIDSMLYHTDLATDENLIRQLQQKHTYNGLLA
jgi:hypothetical protein